MTASFEHLLRDPYKLTAMQTGFDEKHIREGKVDHATRAAWESLLRENETLKELFNKEQPPQSTEMMLFFAKSRQSWIQQIFLLYQIIDELERALSYTKSKLERALERNSSGTASNGW